MPDMDGLLLDTERFYTVVSQQIAARYGKQFSWAIKSKQMGKKAIESCQIFVDELGLQGQLTAEQLLIDREAALDELFPTAQLMPGAERLLRHLAAHNVPCALATGSNRRHFGTKHMRRWCALETVFSHTGVTNLRAENASPYGAVCPVSAHCDWRRGVQGQTRPRTLSKGCCWVLPRPRPRGLLGL